MRRFWSMVVAGALALTVGAAPAGASDADTVKVSMSSGGVAGNSSSYEADVAANGRYVAFRSGASNLVPGDTNQRHDVFVRDLQTGATTRVSVTSTGGQQFRLRDRALDLRGRAVRGVRVRRCEHRRGRVRGRDLPPRPCDG